ncbi:MAG: energy-coupling factor transporter ATPase [Lachnospiraceae bacterium]|nr:energy-coupling factor transporter ATPase [Lachnospiraceae bacterium]
MELVLNHVSYSYDPEATEPKYAVKDVSLTVRDGEFCALIGHTGSGKSTLIQFMNGLLKPTEGEVLFNGENIFDKKYPIRTLRQKVGLVFQYPEHQLFEETVLKDICYGPKNMGLEKDEILSRARHAMKLVGLTENYEEKSPFELSGGEKRRVAIAGVLAMKPECLILDEPTAGLDPAGRDDILGTVRALSDEENIAVMLVSHSMEDVALYAERLLVMNHGTLVYDDTPRNVFKHYKELEEMGLSAPQVTYIAHALREKGFDIDENVMTVAEAKAEILRVMGKGNQ